MLCTAWCVLTYSSSAAPSPAHLAQAHAHQLALGQQRVQLHLQDRQGCTAMAASAPAPRAGRTQGDPGHSRADLGHSSSGRVQLAGSHALAGEGSGLGNATRGQQGTPYSHALGNPQTVQSIHMHNSADNPHKCSQCNTLQCSQSTHTWFTTGLMRA